MKIIQNESIVESCEIEGNTISLERKLFQGYETGTNKSDEYSWFYLICVEGDKGDEVTIRANHATDSTPLVRANGLAFTSADRWRWQQVKQPIKVDELGLKQEFTITLPYQGKNFISNTIFFSLGKIKSHLASFTTQHASVCRQVNIGQSLGDNELSLISFNKSPDPKGRILVTTGCHPAEPDIITSFEIMDYVASEKATELRKNYHIDIMPMQNPDGFQNGSCLTNNGINLYWNFMKNDKRQCPEAYYLWRYVMKNPPSLYLDFHAYVHQHHRHPLPYLKSISNYKGAPMKEIVRAMDAELIKLSNGNYHFGQLSEWPEALSHYITETWNTVAYTKYHINISEGVAKSRARARDIFNAVTAVLIAQQKGEHQLINADPNKLRDMSDSQLMQTKYTLEDTMRKIIAVSKAYYRYYKTKLTT